MFLHINKIEYEKDYQLKLTFNNNEVKKVDLKNELYGEVFEELNNIEKFKQYFLNKNTKTIEWENGADFAPEFLYGIGEPIK